MKFKKLFPLICVVICLFTIASVCASEVNDTAITALDSHDKLEINEDNQVIDRIDNSLCSDDSSNNELTVDDVVNESQDDNMEIPALETADNSDSDELGITDDNLIGAGLRANVFAFNVSVVDNTIFVVNCSDDFNGNVSIKIGDNSLYDGRVNTIIKAAKLPAGNYVSTALFYGDDTYGNLTLNDIGFTVSRVTPTIDVDIDDLCYSGIGCAKVHIGNNANGTVNVTVGGKTFNGTVFNGYADVAIFGLSAGYKNAEIKFFSRDDYNNNVTAYNKFIIYPNNSLIEVHYNQIWHVGDDILININTKNSTGDLKVYINGETYGNPLPYNPERSHDIAISDKGEGSYVVDFRLDGDENYTGYDTTITINVIKKDLTINVTDVVEVIYPGKPVILKAKLNNTVIGNVIFSINGVNYTEYVDNADVVTHEYTPVNNETLTVVATFVGNDIYDSKVSDSKDFNVTRIATNVDVDFYPSAIAGDDVLFYVSMDPWINGVVKLIVGTKYYDVAIVEGSGVYTVCNLYNDTFDVKVEFAGDDKYAGSTSEVKQLFVNKVITNLNINIDKTSMSYHDFAVVGIVLNQSMNAVVTVKVNGNNHTVGLVNGKGSFILNELDKDNYTINAVFAGDDKYVQSTSNSLNLTVTGDNITSSVSLSLNKDSVFVGDDVIIKINFNTTTVTGVIKLNIGSHSYNVAVYKGVGTFTISDLANGTYDVQAIFDGDNKHWGSSSDVKQLEVKMIPTNLSISIDNSSVFVGDGVVVGVVLNQAINNVVTVNVNGKDYIIGIVDGKGNLTLSDLAYGVYTVNATFAGEGKYVDSSSNNVTLEVNKIETQLTGDSVTTVYNIDKDLVITLKDSKGKAISDVEVDVDFNGVKTLKTDSNGQIKLSTKGVVPKEYDAKITFKGNAVYVGSSKQVKVTVKKATPKIAASAKKFKLKDKTKKYTVTLKTNQNKVMKSTVVKITVNKKTYSAKTNSKGVATFKLKKLTKKGKYTATVNYAGSKYYNAKSVKVRITVG